MSGMGMGIGGLGNSMMMTGNAGFDPRASAFGGNAFGANSMMPGQGGAFGRMDGVNMNPGQFKPR
jgi:hypothetical protein